MQETKKPEQFPNAARIMDYFLGGSENLPVDHGAAEGIVKMIPGAARGIRSNRRFLNRAVRTAVRRGISQFLDLGSGIPAAQATHEVAPNARVVYVDKDPVIKDIALRLLSGPASERTAYFESDIRDAETVLSAPATKELLDFSQPIAVLFGAVVHHIDDADDPYGLVERYKQPMASGSLAIITHGSYDYVSREVRAATDELYGKFRTVFALRSRSQVARFLDTPGWTLLEPGVVSVNEWETADEPASVEDYQTTREEAAGFAAVAVKN